MPSLSRGLCSSSAMNCLIFAISVNVIVFTGIQHLKLKKRKKMFAFPIPELRDRKHGWWVQICNTLRHRSFAIEIFYAMY